MKMPIICISLSLISFCIEAQKTVPVYRSAEDSVKLVELSNQLSNISMRVGSERKVYDSLMRLNVQLRAEGILGYRIIYSANPNYTQLDELSSDKDPATVTQLSIASYKGKRIPKEVFDCSNLQALELVNTKIQKLPGRLRHMRGLNTVYIYNNRSEKPLRFARNKSIRTLIVKGGHQDYLPSSYKSLKALYKLDLSGNFITHFPDISKNKNIDELILKGNQISLNDKKVKPSKTLTQLDLQGNKISHVPSWLGDFENLKKLLFNYNNINQVDDNIGRLQHLKELSFYRNELAHIPKGVYQLQQLQNIDLYFNQIEVVDPEIGSLSHLEALYLSNNRIYSIPEEIGQLKRLKELYVHNNRLSYLPDNLAKLSNLEVLRINNNSFTSFPTAVLKLTQLENLDVSRNNLQEIPMEITSFKNLKIFSVVDNPIEKNYRDKLDLIRDTLRANGTTVHMNSWEKDLEKIEVEN